MSGRIRPLDCCDGDCALVNGCRIGGYQCERCGRWFCANEIGERGLCYDCESEATDDAEDEINEEWFGESKEEMTNDLRT